MKKIIPFATLTLSSLLFFGCGQDDVNYTGCWLGEENMAFEVLTENGTDFTIRNINGDLKATIQDGALRGRNALDMEYKMNVKGDSAYYEFGGIITGYKRITKEEYEKVVAALQKAITAEETPAAEAATETPTAETPAAESSTAAAPAEKPAADSTAKDSAKANP